MSDSNGCSPISSKKEAYDGRFPSQGTEQPVQFLDTKPLPHTHENSTLSLLNSSSAASLSSSDTDMTDLKRSKNVSEVKTMGTVPLLPGEFLITDSPVTFLKSVGVLSVTNYKLFFYSSEMKGGVQEKFEVPLGVISRVDKVRTTSSKGENSYGIEIHCKDLRHLRFACLPTSRPRSEVFRILQQNAFPIVYKKQFFAFHYNERFAKNGWAAYDPIAELKRMGVPNDMWRITHINESYEFCDTYPAVFSVPKEATDDDLRQVALFRSRARIPILCWLHPVSGASITRASQPLVGIGSRSGADEELVKQLFDTNPHAHKLFIMDARPNVNAVANRARGGGYESEEKYKNTEVVFLDIHNIHVMRESLRKLKDVCYPEIDEAKWLSNLEATHWLSHIRQILSGAVRVADKIENHKNSVLVHCSDGWDRTAQLTALAMLMLDPNYRTLHGFQVLIEREWTSAGHKFAQRVGHGDDKHSDSERSPVFMQFIDCVWQITQQFPHAFEFNEHLLVTILDHLYSCKYGTFLFNCERERKNERVFEETQSLWSEVNSTPKFFLNPFYTARAVEHAIFPVASIRKLRLWKTYYVRWNTRMRPQENLAARQLQLLSSRSCLEKSLQDLQMRVEAHSLKSGAASSTGLMSPSVQV